MLTPLAPEPWQQRNDFYASAEKDLRVSRALSLKENNIVTTRKAESAQVCPIHKIGRSIGEPNLDTEF